MLFAFASHCRLVGLDGFLSLSFSFSEISNEIMLLLLVITDDNDVVLKKRKRIGALDTNVLPNFIIVY